MLCEFVKFCEIVKRQII